MYREKLATDELSGTRLNLLTLTITHTIKILCITIYKLPFSQYNSICNFLDV